MQCRQELCEYWSGDGNVCPCSLFGIGPDGGLEEDDEEEGYEWD